MRLSTLLVSRRKYRKNEGKNMREKIKIYTAPPLSLSFMFRLARMKF